MGGKGPGSFQLRPGQSLMSCYVVVALCNSGLSSKRADVREALAGSGDDVDHFLGIQCMCNRKTKFRNGMKMSLLPYLDDLLSRVALAL